MKLLTPMRSRTAALGILFLVVILAATALVAPVWLLNQRYSAAAEDAAGRLERYSRVVGMREGLLQKAQEIKALENTRHFLKSASPALAASELQEQVTVILEQNGGKLSSIQILPHKDDGRYRQISLVLQFNAQLGAVKAILHALESAHPYLFVDNMMIRVPNSLGQPKELTSDPELIVQFDLTGYALKGVQ
jgi:general secretion pathway protein M